MGNLMVIFILQRVPETSLVKGNQGEVIFLISRKSCCKQYHRFLEYQETMVKNLQKPLGSAGGNLTYFPLVTKSKITTH